MRRNRERDVVRVNRLVLCLDLVATALVTGIERANRLHGARRRNLGIAELVRDVEDEIAHATFQGEERALLPFSGGGLLASLLFEIAHRFDERSMLLLRFDELRDA